jgi:hypothetical protein
MTYTVLGADWTAVAEQAIRTGFDIYGAITTVKAVRDATKDAIEQAKAEYYLSVLVRKQKEAEAASALAKTQSGSKLTSQIAVGGIGLLALFALMD